MGFIEILCPHCGACLDVCTPSAISGTEGEHLAQPKFGNYTDEVDLLAKEPPVLPGTLHPAIGC